MRFYLIGMLNCGNIEFISLFYKIYEYLLHIATNFGYTNFIE